MGWCPDVFGRCGDGDPDDEVFSDCDRPRDLERETFPGQTSGPRIDPRRMAPTATTRRTEPADRTHSMSSFRFSRLLVSFALATVIAATAGEFRTARTTRRPPIPRSSPRAGRVLREGRAAGSQRTASSATGRKRRSRAASTSPPQGHSRWRRHRAGREPRRSRPRACSSRRSTTRTTSTRCRPRASCRTRTSRCSRSG